MLAPAPACAWEWHVKQHGALPASYAKNFRRGWTASFACTSVSIGRVEKIVLESASDDEIERN